MLPTVIIVVILVVIISMYFMVTYNSLVKYRNWIEESFHQIDVQLRRRYDLIPNLVETVKESVRHEHDTLVKVIEARSKINVGTPGERVRADNQLQATLRSLYNVTESYPNLKANKQFRDLRDELISTENKLSHSRSLYNRTVAEYNIKRERFPTILFASVLGFHKEELLETPDEAREPVKVEF